MDLINETSLESLRAMDEGAGIFLRDILALYLNESENILNEIVNEATSGSIEKMNKAAHKLKGSSLSVGAIGFAEQCSLFEKTSSFQSDEEKNEMISKLKDLYSNTKKEFDKIISSN